MTRERLDNFMVPYFEHTVAKTVVIIGVIEVFRKKWFIWTRFDFIRFKIILDINYTNHTYFEL